MMPKPHLSVFPRSSTLRAGLAATILPGWVVACFVTCLVTGLVTGLASGLAAQDRGRGSLTADGLEARLQLLQHGVGTSQDFEIRVDRLGQLPRNGAVLLMIGPKEAEISLAGLGLPKARLGVDPGSAFILPLPRTTPGLASFRIRLLAAWKGAALYAQAIIIDPRLRGSQLAFSDSRSIMLGSEGASLVLARAAGAGSIDMLRLQADGRPGVPLAQLKKVTIRSFAQAAIAESRVLREDLPRPVRIGGHNALRLEDGSTIVLATRGQHELFIRSYRTGRVDIIHEDLVGSHAAAIIARPGYLAFSDLAGKRLWIYRTNGDNWPGSASPLHFVPSMGFSGMDVHAMGFGTRVLAMASRFAGMLLVPLDGSPAFRPKLPMSGGRRPSIFDEEIAVSGDGRSFALGAGSGKKVKDIYVVRDDGRSFNVTKAPKDYAEVGYGNPGRRVELLLDLHGSLVSYVDESGKEPENFVAQVQGTQRRHLTSNNAFVNSIDIGSTSRFPPKGGVLMFAGLNAQSLDLFYSPTIQARDMLAMTNTGGATKPPFGRNGKLALIDLAALRTASPYTLRARRSGQSSNESWLIEPSAKRARKLPSSGEQLLSLRDGKRFIACSPGGLVLIDPSKPGTSFARKTDFKRSGSIQALIRLAASDRLAISFGSQQSRQILLVDPIKGSVQRLDKQASASGPLRSAPFGGFHMLSAPRPNQGRQLQRWQGSQGLKKLGGSQLLYFLQ